MLNNTTIIIPIYNEGLNIWLLIDTIFSQYSGISILVVDDFSGDNGVEIVKQKKRLYKDQLSILEKEDRNQKWLTYSIIYWINHISTEYFIVMDGDFQHPVENIHNFLEWFVNSVDIVIWERKKIIFEEKKYRVLISQFWNYIINQKLKKTWLHFKDPLSWFFGWKTYIYKNVIIKHKKVFLWKGYKFLFEFLKSIQKWEYNIQTFDFNFAKRKFWESKITLIIFKEFLKWFFR